MIFYTDKEWKDMLYDEYPDIGRMLDAEDAYYASLPPPTPEEIKRQNRINWAMILFLSAWIASWVWYVAKHQ